MINHNQKVVLAGLVQQANEGRNMFFGDLKYKVKYLEKEILNNRKCLEALAFDLKNPNGKMYSTEFWYSYNVKIIEVPLSCSLIGTVVDYTKINDGYILVNEDRSMAWFIRFGENIAIRIPFPCTHD
jgi:hypothetical protein